MRISDWSSDVCSSDLAYRGTGDRHFALGHNGNLTNTEALADEAGMLPGTVTSDTDLIAELIAAELAHLPDDRSDDRDLDRALEAVLPRLEGAFSLVVMDESRVIGVRDPNGFRPLCLGKLEHGWVLASESPALDLVGAHFVRELDPGAMVVIDATGPRSVRPFPSERVDPKLCLFDFVYFARPDTRLYNQSVHQSRIHIGDQDRKSTRLNSSH